MYRIATNLTIQPRMTVCVTRLGYGSLLRICASKARVGPLRLGVLLCSNLKLASHTEMYNPRGRLKCTNGSENPHVKSVVPEQTHTYQQAV